MARPLCRSLAPVRSPLLGSVTRATHKELPNLPPASSAGCNHCLPVAAHSQGGQRSSSRHFGGSSTSPQKRVFKSFP
jgi:hypothetical protein